MLDHDAAAGFGPFFATSTHTLPPGPPWRPMGELVDGGPALAARIEQVRVALAAPTRGRPVEARVAASVAQLGLSARVVAPLLGRAVLGETDPVLDLADLYWQPELGGPFPLSLPERSNPVEAPSGPLASSLHTWLEGPVSALVAATLREVRVAPAVLWGNVASAVHSAGQLVRTARPDLAARAATVTETALAHPLLRAEHEGGRSFRRRSCCLMYRVATPARPRSVCGDCALVS